MKSLKINQNNHKNSLKFPNHLLPLYLITKKMQVLKFTNKILL